MFMVLVVGMLMEQAMRVLEMQKQKMMRRFISRQLLAPLNLLMRVTMQLGSFIPCVRFMRV